ncbi:hypothetical protein [Micromonospora olivasterospora]|uniref:Peptidase MA superfamily protein n=1 Tax=Micromonospora olivasterospora TaxID=1880 RepID=A0A562I906_MICOL|nr:hypothetical protein [Micromonospora olivasterospora]TWH67520.1 hypothetical protein JD77_02497 [Micromonospora olivasterospora]
MGPPAPPGSYRPPAPYPPPAQFGPAGPYAPPPPAQFGPAGPYAPPPPAKRSRRWLWISLTAVLVVLALCAGSAFALKTYVDRQTATSAALDEGDDPIRPAEIEALLAEHTRALKDRDLKAFLAPFDPADKKLVAQQTTLFRNLSDVPLAEAGFVRLRTGEFTPVGAGHSVELTVSFNHRFEYDRAPVGEMYTWTVVRPHKGAPLKITEAGHIPQGFRQTELSYYPAPWDKWQKLHVEKTPHTVLIVDASLRAEAQRYAPVAERAAAQTLAAVRDGGVTAEFPQGFVISLVKGEKELAALYQTRKEPATGESGLALGFPPASAVDDDQGPDVGGSRVLIDVTDRSFFGAGAQESPSVLFRHELAHAIMNNFADHGPRATALDRREHWVVEGFAEYLGYGQQPFTASDRAASGKEVLRSLNYDLPLPSNGGWNMAGRGSYHYWLAHSTMSYVAERYGEQKVFQLVIEHYRGKTVEDVTREVLGVSYGDFAKQWAAYVKAEAR